MDEYHHMGVFVCAFLVSATGGLAALLRSKADLTKLSVANSTLNSGVLGLGVSLLWYVQFKENVYALVGVCVLLGLGGMTMIDFVLETVRRGGLSINFKDAEKKHDDDK